MDSLAGCALLNTARMLDEFFGLLLRQLGSKPVNLVLYADHGMSMFEQDYDAEAAMSEVAGDNVEFLYYPNLHLRDPSLAQATAEKLAARDELDSAFYRADESLIVGVLMKGPDIDPSKISDTFCLHKLHRDILEIDPGNPETARRERNSLMVSDGRIELQASPAHRWNGMLSAGSDGWAVTCERSLARSLMTQILTGLGITSDGEPAGSPTPVASSRLNFYLDPLVYEYKNLIFLPSGKRISSSSLRVETKFGVILEWSHPNRIGLGITW